MKHIRTFDRLNHFQWLAVLMAFPWTIALIAAIIVLCSSCVSHNPRYRQQPGPYMEPYAPVKAHKPHSK